MAREIDLTEGYEALSRDDLLYLQARCRLPEQYAHLLEEDDTEDAEIEIEIEIDYSDEGDPDEEETTEEADEESDEEATLPPYEEWSKKELFDEAVSRGLKAKANAKVADLVALLEADDAEGED